MPLWTRWIVNVMAGPGSSEEDTARSRNAAARSSPSLAWKAFSLERMEGNDEHDRVLGLCSGHARGFQQGRYIALDIKPKISKFMRHEGLSSRPPSLPLSVQDARCRVVATRAVSVNAKYFQA